MTRLPRLALLAFASVVVAAGCGGSSGTPTPPPIKDANEVIVRSVDNIELNPAAAKSLHVQIDVSGKLNIGAFMPGGASSGLGSSYDITGTTIAGDVDVANQAVDLKLTIPGIPGGTGELIVAGNNAYYKFALLYPDGKFRMTPLTNSPISLPSPTALDSPKISQDIADVTKGLSDLGATATLKGTDKVDGKDAYHVSMVIPPDKLNSLLSQGGSTTAGMTIDSLTFDYWVYTDTVLPAKLALAVSSAALGNLSITVTLTAYGKAVTINAPAAGDIATS